MVSVVSPSDSFSRGSLGLSASLPLIVPPAGSISFENKHWDQFWELKDLAVRKDWAGLLFVTGTFSCPRVGKKVGRGPQNKKNPSPGVVCGHSGGSWPSGCAAIGPHTQLP